MARATEQDLRLPVGTDVTRTPPGRVFVRNVAMVFDAHAPDQRSRVFARTV